MQTGTIYVELDLDSSGFDEGLADAESSAENSGGKITNVLGNIGKIALGGAVAGVVALGAALFEGVQGAAEAEQIMAQTEAVIKSTGGAANLTATEVSDLAASLSAASGASLFGDDQIQGAENILLTFTNIKDASFEAATAIAVDMATALGTDPQSQAMALGKALNDPIAGVAALSRVGVTFTEQQKAQIEAMQTAGDVAGAQQIILAELGKEFGGSAAASAATFTGQLTTLKDKFGELLESIGAKVLPMLTMFIGFLNSPEVQNGIQMFADALVNGVEVTMTFISDVVIPAFMTAFNLISPLFTSVGTQVTAFGEIWQALQPVITAVTNYVQTVITVVFSAIQAFLKANGADIQAFITTTWTAIKDIIIVLVKLINATIVPIFNIIAGFIKEHGDTITTLLTNAWTVIKAVITIAIALIKGILNTALALIKGDWQGAWESIKTMVNTIWEAIKSIIGAAISNIKLVLSLAWEAIKGVALAAWNAVKEGILTSINDAKTGLDTTINNIKTALLNAWNAIKTTASTAWSAMVTIINDPIGSAKRGLDLILESMKGLLLGAWESVRETASSKWETISNTIKTAFDVKAKIDGVISDVKEALSSAWGSIQSTAKGAWEGIANSIGSAFDGVTSKIKGIVNQAIRYVNRLISAYNEVASTLGLDSLGRISELASGTNNFAGGLALVGERGPELVALPRGSQVTPAGKTREMLNNSRTINFNQYITQMVSPSQELAMVEAFSNSIT
jgi:phage-related protein